MSNLISIDPKSEHKFWSKEPIAFTLNQNEQSHVNSAIETSTPDQIQTKSSIYHQRYEWWNPDLNKDDQLMQIYSFLAKNYVEDTDQMFRFDYSPHFLRWALMPPGWQNHWSIGVRCKRNQILVGFVSAIPSPMVVYAKEVKMVMINFLCVHKKLRLKRLAPLLIREITRRVNLQNVWQPAILWHNTAKSSCELSILSSQFESEKINWDRIFISQSKDDGNSIGEIL